MSSGDIQFFFHERRDEVTAYIELIKNIDQTRQRGTFAFAADQVSISPLQQQILYANVFVQLYNLVEATITRCLDELHAAAIAGHTPADLAPPILREWVRSKAGTHTDRAHERRLDAAVDLARHLIETLPVDPFKIESGGGGNWDDRKIEKIAVRIGCQLGIDSCVRENAKRHVRDELGSLQLVRDLRNRLAHGLMSFGECGADMTASDIEAIASAVLDYLDAVVKGFVSYFNDRAYLESPEAVGAA